MKRCSAVVGIFLLIALVLATPARSQTAPPTADPPGPMAAETAKAASAGSAGHTQSGACHVDPFSLVMLELAGIVLLAVVGRWIAGRLGQSSVLGELGIGMLVGNIGYWLSIPFFVLTMHLGEAGQVISEALRTNVAIGQAAADMARAGTVAPALAGVLIGPDATRAIMGGIALWIFSNLGIILLMFMVGLGTSVSEMKAVGGRATVVALAGVAASFVFGYAGGRLVLPAAGQPVWLFLGVVLCSTSVGISARVFQALRREQCREAKIVFGSSVIDDIVSIVVLAVVVGIATTGRADLASAGRILLLAAIFLGGLFFFGERLAARIASRFEALEGARARLLVPVVLAFFLSALASRIQLATITGAFGAGLIVSDRIFGAKSGFTVEDLLKPLEDLFAPVFFVLMGMQVNLGTLAQPSIVATALVLTLAAVLGKAAAGCAAGPGADRLVVGLGVIPRGEEALLFASIGASLGVLTGGLFSAVVIMVMLTAVLTPVFLTRALLRRQGSG